MSDVEGVSRSDVKTHPPARHRPYLGLLSSVARFCECDACCSLCSGLLALLAHGSACVGVLSLFVLRAFPAMGYRGCRN